MNKVLVKYVDSNDIYETGYIQAVYTDSPYELLRMTKQADYIEIDSEYYQYESSTYKVPKTKENVDCIIIYLDPMGD